MKPSNILAKSSQNYAGKSSQLPTRPKVLDLYKRILRAGKSWEVQKERGFILEEAHELFKANKDITDVDKIEEKIFEAEARLELAIHYKIPYPRLTNVGPGTVADSIENVEDNMYIPRYLDSYKPIEPKRKEQPSEVDF